jgi:hypothetical protein
MKAATALPIGICETHTETLSKNRDKFLPQLELYSDVSRLSPNTTQHPIVLKDRNRIN